MLKMLLSRLGQRQINVRPWRPAWLPRDIRLCPEANAHSHDPLERADLFLAYNAGSTEMEVLNWLHATIVMLKPSNILETGAADGFGTLALAAACKANGFGKVHSIELDPEVCGRAEERIRAAGLTEWVDYHCADSRAFLRGTSLKFDFAFYDSLCELRAEECEICLERGILCGPAVFHDTSPYRTRTMKEWPAEPLHQEYRAALQRIAEKYYEGKITESTLSRGITLMFPRTYPLRPHNGA